MLLCELGVTRILVTVALSAGNRHDRRLWSKRITEEAFRCNGGRDCKAFQRKAIMTKVDEKAGMEPSKCWPLPLRYCN